MTPPPLDGVRVIDLGLLLPGPFASRLLADLGADVIKVEPPWGDPGRTLLAGLTPFLERGKRAVRVDLRAEGAAEFVLDLVAGADVVIEGFRPGVADRLGVGFEAAAASNPRIVYCSISGYGQDGPAHRQPAHDANIQASAGALAGMLAAGEEPITPYLPMADQSAALFAALSIVATLYRTIGDGPPPTPVHLDVSMQEAMLQVALPRWGTVLTGGGEPTAEELVAYSPGAGVFPTSDRRHVSIGAIEDKF